MNRPRTLLKWIRTRARFLLPAFGLILVGNWFWAADEARQIGGTALGGYVRDGHYFVTSHGSYTEVSHDQWTWSLVHAIATFASWPLAIALVALLSIRWRTLLTGPDLSQSAKRRDLVLRSGGAFQTVSLVVGFGSAGTSSQISLELHPRGVIVGPETGDPKAVLADDVLEIHDAGADVVIDHTAPELATPLRVFVDPRSPVAAALRRSLGRT